MDEHTSAEDVSLFEMNRKLSRDLRELATGMSAQEVRYLVDAYYIYQEGRKRSANQVRALSENQEPAKVIAWLQKLHDQVENSIKGALQAFAQTQAVGKWSLGVYGVGPVIASGLLAHIDISKCDTVGHIWAHAGYDPNVKWLGKVKATEVVKRHVAGKQWTDEELTAIASEIHRKEGNLRALLVETGEDGKDVVSRSRSALEKMLAKPPHNAKLKTLLWKIGQSFLKFHKRDECEYGPWFMERWQYEQERNESGYNEPAAAAILEEKNIGKTTDAYAAYSQGKLPPAHILARACRWTVKLFLSHWHYVAYFELHGEPPPKPYVLTQEGGHAHFIAPPGYEMLKKKQA